MKVRFFSWKRLVILVLIANLIAGLAALTIVIVFNNSSVPAVDPSARYSEEQIVCRGTTSPSCADRAAKRSGLAVAWINESVARPYLMVVPRPGVSIQELESREYIISIMSGDPPGAGGNPVGYKVRTVRSNGIVADVLLERDPKTGFRAVWVAWKSNEGIPYLIGVTHRRHSIRPAIAYAVGVFETIRYASPSE